MRRLASILALALAACGGDDAGNGHLVTEERTVGEFTDVSVGSGLDATVNAGPRSVLLTLDDNLLSLVETVVEGTQLVVRTRAGTGGSGRAAIAWLVTGPRIGQARSWTGRAPTARMEARHCRGGHDHACA